MSPILNTITSGALIRGKSSIVSNQLALNYIFSDASCYSGTGSTVNSLAQTYTGTVTGATFSSRYFNFDGNSDWIGVSFPFGGGFEQNNALSVEAWIYPTSYYFASDSFIVARGAANSFDLKLLAGSASVQARIYDVSGTPTYREATTPTSSISLNNWYHVVGTYSPNLISIYLNNSATSTVISPSASLIVNPSSNSTSPLRIGTYIETANSFPFIGRIGEVRIYRKELSASEVAQNYNSTKFKYGL